VAYLCFFVLNIPTAPVRKTVFQLNHQKFIETLANFFRHQNPSQFIPSLIRQMETADNFGCHAVQISKIINRCVSPSAIASPHVKMRIFWLIGEIFDKENVYTLQTLRSQLNIKTLFWNFLQCEDWFGLVC